jgi:hypothetical protein
VGFDQTTPQSWQQAIRNLEASFKRHDLKTFFGDVNRLCTLKPSAPIVAGLETTDGEVIYNRSFIEKQLADEFRARQQLPGLSSFNVNNGERTLFTTEDVVRAIRETNFDKGLGPDSFDGNVLLKSPELHNKVCADVANALNRGMIPDHLKIGRMIALSKRKGSSIASSKEVRHIAILSHLAKIIEKMILNKIVTTKSELL